MEHDWWRRRRSELDLASVTVMDDEEEGAASAGHGMLSYSVSLTFDSPRRRSDYFINYKLEFIPAEVATEVSVSGVFVGGSPLLEAVEDCRDCSGGDRLRRVACCC